MPRGDAFAAALFPAGVSKAVVRGKVITPVEALTLSTALRADAADFYYSAWVSFLDALNGMRNEFLTWAAVKLYYSVFYTFRASLAASRVCAFHVNRSPFIVTADAGQSPTSGTEAGTHKTVLRGFEKKNPAHVLVSQQIDLVSAVDWLISVRETANYVQARFSEPSGRDEFDLVISAGLRKTLNAYLAEKSLLYVFDPDHALVAYPLRALQLIGADLLVASLTNITELEQQFLRRKTRDNVGQIAVLNAEIDRIMSVV